MKSKYLIILAVVVALLAGTSYLFLQTSGAQQPKGVPSVSAIAPGTPQVFATKPGLPGPQKPSVKPTVALGAYGLSTSAVKPEKVEGYQPPHHEIPPSALRQEGGETCADAYAISLPFNSTGYTCDNVDDYEEVCPYSSTSPDVVYSYTPSTDEVINIDLYGSSYDTKVFVYEDNCVSPYYACNDDYYSDYTSAIFGLPIYSGHTYYIVVDGYGGDCGDYLIDVTLYQPCDVVCPPEGILEGEPVCYDEYVDNYNGGCNTPPNYPFQTIDCNTTICGTSGTYLYTGYNYRDTDWFRLVITQPTTLTFKCVAEFPLLIFLIDALNDDCVSYTILTSATANPCDTATIVWSLQPKTYYLWVGPSVFSGYPCGLEYVAIVQCEFATTGACCYDLDPYTCTIETPENCAAMPNHTFQGLGTNCGPPNPCLPGPPNDECTGAILVSPPDCPNVVTVSGTTVGATIDCPGVLDWYAVWYRFDLPYASNKLTIDYCPTAIPIYQIGIVLYNSCPVNCSNYILASVYQFVTCPNSNTGPQMWWSGLPAGTYYLPVAVWDYGMNPFNDFVFTACVEAAVAPPNDNCANATPVGDVTNLAFSTEGATFDGPGSCQYAPNIWYCYTATCDGNAHVSLCNSSYDTKMAAYEGCTCDPVGTMLACVDDACGGTLQSEISFPVVMGQSYLIEVGGYGTATGSGFLSITCSLPPPNDECTGAPIISTFPQTAYGTTIGAAVDCPDVLAWNAVWYQFDLPYDCNNVTVDFCATNNAVNTVGIVLYNSCPPDCPSYILSTGYQWLSCPNGYSNPEVYWYNLPAGSYWFPVYLGTGMDFGFTVSVEECVPCDVVCPSGGIPEGEPTCYDEYVDSYNGGCNSSPYVFQNINCNTTICGTSGTYLFTGLQYRETDWFRVEAGDGELTFKAVAEFPLQTILLAAGSENCADYTQLDYRQVNMCDTATISMYVSAGVYWLWVGPSVFTGYPCGLEYVMEVQCTGFGPQIAVTPTSFDQLLNPTGACSSATKDLIISSVGGEDLNWSIAENPPAAWLSVSPTSGTLPPGQKDTLDVSFNAGGMTPGDYNTSLDITSNAPKGVVSVPVHLKVELPPEINVATRLWVPVIPGCSMDNALRVDNLGAGALSFEVSVKKNPPKQADVLLVDDDNSYNYPVDFTDVVSYFTAALDANGYTYTIFEVASVGGDGPDAATMADYPVVIWFTGESWQLNQTLTPNDEANLATYLDGGGNLFLSGQDYFYDRYPSAGSFSPGQFPYDYLGVTYVSQDLWGIYYPSTGSCDGMAGSVADGMTFDLWDPYTAKGLHSKGPDDGLYIDEITHNGVDLFNMTNPSPEGIAACQYEGAGFKTVFTTVDFAGLLDTKSTMTEFMGSIMNWFMGAACPFTVSPEEGTIPAESFFDVFLTFDGTVFEDCVEETLTCYLVFTSNDCDEPEVTVPVYMWSARGDVNGDCKLDVVDVVFLLNWIFIGGPTPDPLCMGDVNRSGGDPDSDDALYLISYLFMYGPPPQILLAPSR